MEKKIGKQLSIFIGLLAILWILLLALQIRLAKKAYSHQKDLFAVKLNAVFEDALTSIEAVDYLSLDSVVSLSLQSHNAPYPHDLGVYSEDNHGFIYLTENADEEALLEKGFRFKMRRVVDDHTQIETIMLHFPGLVKNFRREMVIGYMAIFLLLVLLLCCFINFFYIILKQRRLFLFREKMAHFITHELKTPLTTINLSAQLLKDDSVVTDEAAKNSYLDVIADETKVLETLVDEVLTIFSANNVPMAEMKEVRIHEILEGICKVHAPQLRECQAEVNFDFKADSDLVMGNYTHLFNAFSNLLDNAIKYRKGRLRLDFSTQNIDHTIVIKVTDNGIGIKKENLSLIFEPFSRFNTDDAHYVKGFGLGLDYVKHIVEYHKGNIKVDSELGEGTSFTVSLPLKNN